MPRRKKSRRVSLRILVGVHEQRGAAMAIRLTHRHRDLAVLVRSYRGMKPFWRERCGMFADDGLFIKQPRT